MVGWPFCNPALQEGSDIRFEEAACVGVTCGGNGSVDAFALGEHEFEAALRIHADTEHCDGALLDFELDARAASWLAVVLAQAAEDRLGGGYVDVVWPVMAH